MLRFIFSLLFITSDFSDFFDCPGFDNFNPYGKSSSGDQPNPWAERFGNIWSNKPSGSTKDKPQISPDALRGRYFLFQFLNL